MLTVRGRVALVLTFMVFTCALAFVGLAKASINLRPNIQDYIEHQR